MNFGIRHEDGWTGAFTRQEAEGAIPNGSLIMKVNSEDEDGMPDGVAGIVLGSIDVTKLGAELRNIPGVKRPPDRFVYWVEWRLRKKQAVFIMDWKIAEPPKP